MVTKNKFTGMPDEERLKKLAAMPDEDIDYSDIPPTTDFTNWKNLIAANHKTLITPGFVKSY